MQNEQLTKCLTTSKTEGGDVGSVKSIKAPSNLLLTVQKR